MTAPATDPTPAVNEDAALVEHLTGPNDGERFLDDLIAGSEPLDGTPSEGTEPPKVEAKPDDAPKAATEPVVEAGTPPVDPFAELVGKGKPLTYKVSGAERTFDGIVTLPDGKGAFVPPDKLDHVQRALSSAEANRESNRQLYEQVQGFQRLSYEGPANAQGQRETFTGLDAHYRMQEDLAAVNTVAGLLFETLTTPAKLLGLLTLDANNNVVPNPQALRDLQDRATFLRDRASFDARQNRATTTQQFEVKQQDAALREAAIPDAIDRAFPDADPADREAAKAYFGQFRESLLFVADADAASQYGVAPGTLMVAVQKMAPWFAERAENRVRTTKEAEARRKAEAENQARLAQKPANPAPVRPTSTQQNRDPKTGKFAEGTTTRKMTHAEILRAIRRGEDIPDDGLIAV